MSLPLPRPTRYGPPNSDVLPTRGAVPVDEGRAESGDVCARCLYQFDAGEPCWIGPDGFIFCGRWCAQQGPARYCPSGRNRIQSNQKE